MVFRRRNAFLQKGKFLKFRPSKNRLRMISKLPHIEKNKFICMNTV